MARSLLLTSITLLSLSLTSCTSMMRKLDHVGEEPKFTEIGNPITPRPGEKVYWPQSETPVNEPKNVNSLWQPGAAAFFKDRRARRVGDILKVVVKIEDKAKLDNKTTTTRTSTENASAPNIFGFEQYIGKVLPGAADAGNLINTTGNRSMDGTGKIDRKESIAVEVAAMVTQILPNGNLVIKGTQETRINYEVREVGVQGIVRPEDIASDNSVDYSQIAEARISYGGRGHLSDVQQPRLGNQVLDIVSPF